MSTVKKQNNKVPKVRFSEFSNSYEEYSFEDLFIFSTGKNIKQNEAAPEFKIPCVRYGELYYMYGEVITKIINRTNLSESELRLSKGNEILLPSAGEDPMDIGSASALTLKGVAIGRTINVLRPAKDKTVVQIYVAYYINQKLRRKISTLAKGYSISNVYNSDLKKLKIILPTFPEQQKVADLLQTTDAWLDNLRQQKTALETYKRGMVQKLFTQQVRFKDDNGKDFPEWQEKKVGDVSVKSNTGVAAGSLEGNDGEYAVYGASGLYKHVDFYQEEEPYIAIIKDGSGVGRTSIYPGKSSVIGTLNVIKPESGVDTYFLYMLVSQLNLLKYVVGGAIPHIYYKDYKREKVMVPVIEEQRKISGFLAALDDTISAKAAEIASVEQWKKGLMQKLFI